MGDDIKLPEPAFPFEPDRADVNPDGIESADADAIASGVDPEELGLDENTRPEDAEKDPEATS